eukprot:scaffold118899_cov63-Phaeocystis_antarctica.AAC.1
MLPGNVLPWQHRDEVDEQPRVSVFRGHPPQRHHRVAAFLHPRAVRHLHGCDDGRGEHAHGNHAVEGPDQPVAWAEDVAVDALWSPRNLHTIGQLVCVVLRVDQHVCPQLCPRKSAGRARDGRGGRAVLGRARLAPDAGRVSSAAHHAASCAGGRQRSVSPTDLSLESPNKSTTACTRHKPHRVAALLVR